MVNKVSQLCTNQHFTPGQSGATLAAALILVTAGMLLAISALRSATTEAQLASTLIAGQDAFWLAELGVATGISFALNQPADLPEATSLNLAATTPPGRGHTKITIHQNGTDAHCPSLAPLNSVRHHYEIHATGFADRGAISTHVQGFYICSELCTSLYCDIAESPPVKSYWKSSTGGMPPSETDAPGPPD
jgi:Tfp pilus assembly protein PilX